VFKYVKSDTKAQYEKHVLKTYANKIATRDSLDFVVEQCYKYRKLLIAGMHDQLMQLTPLDRSLRTISDHIPTVAITTYIKHKF
jgi:hypothetical protein